MATYDVYIYARGGGAGHLVRGLVLRQQLMAQGARVALVGQACAANYFPQVLQQKDVFLLDSNTAALKLVAHTLIVDSFPFGWRDEISHRFLTEYSHRRFIARYHKYPAWEFVQACYQSIVLPYSAQTNEWDWAPSHSELAGLLLRRDFPRYSTSGDALKVLDPAKRLSPLFISKIEHEARARGLLFEYLTTLPPHLSARKLLVVGAGYNTFFELYTQGGDICFIPIKKAFDDQHRRAAKFGRSISSVQSLLQWLDDPKQVRSRRFPGEYYAAH